MNFTLKLNGNNKRIRKAYRIDVIYFLRGISKEKHLLISETVPRKG